ncbi:hypothetical protein CBR_g34777 [Chara braunii]|uniref:Uncharacterized protein n=1 Tax=Chara braunii TaxID=69332 RepID=A0A388LJH8_CHABU|nr:hypothetical protein CBR_g34777 [Chara braunii]|eukprot:GBG82401.1 hypothetical protein CBR_g34777 [Chara braunii]
MVRRTEEIRLQLEAGLEEKWRQQTKQVVEAAATAKAKAEEARARAEEAHAKADEAQANFEKARIEKVRMSVRRTRDTPADSSRKRVREYVSEEVTSEDSDSDGDTTDSDEELRRTIERLKMEKRARKSGKRGRSKKREDLANEKTPYKTPDKIQSTTERVECSKGKARTRCNREDMEDFLRNTNDIGCGFGEPWDEINQCRGSPRMGGIRFNIPRGDGEMRADEPRTPMEKGYKGLAAKCSREEITASLDLKEDGVYIVASPWSKKVYVGSTIRSTMQRWREHLSNADTEVIGSSPELYRWMRHYGPGNFVIIPVRHANEEDDRAFKRHLIQDFSPSHNTCNTSNRGTGKTRNRRKGKWERKRLKTGQRERKGVVRFMHGRAYERRVSLKTWLEEEWIKNTKGERRVQFHGGEIWWDGWREIKRLFGMTKVRINGRVKKLSTIKGELQQGLTVVFIGITKTTTTMATYMRELRWMLKKPILFKKMVSYTTNQLVEMYRAAGFFREKKTKNDLRLKIDRAVKKKTGVGIRKRVQVKVTYDKQLVKREIRQATEGVVGRKVKDAAIANQIKGRVKVSRRGRMCTLSKTRRVTDGYVDIRFESIFAMVEYDLNNAYANCGQVMRRHISGIPMGKCSSPILATITCAMAEFDMLKGLASDRKLVGGWRIVDDIMVVEGRQAGGRSSNDEVFGKLETSYDEKLTLVRKDRGKDWWHFQGGSFYLLQQPVRQMFVLGTKNLVTLRETASIRYQTMQDYALYSEKRSKKSTLEATLKRLWSSTSCQVLVIGSIAYTLWEAYLRGIAPEVSLGALAKLVKATSDPNLRCLLQMLSKGFLRRRRGVTGTSGPGYEVGGYG